LLALVAGLDVCAGARKRNANAVLNRFTEIREGQEVVDERDEDENEHDAEDDHQALVDKDEDENENDAEHAMSLQQEGEAEEGESSAGRRRGGRSRSPRRRGSRSRSPRRRGSRSRGGSPSSRGVYHFVAFAYNKGVNAAEVRREFLKLKGTCLKDGKRVISEISSGDQSSPEKIGQGYTDGFMVKFTTGAMRDYYIGCPDKTCQEGGRKPAGGFCQSHDDFKFFVGPKLAGNNVPNAEKFYNPGVLVFDYKGVAAGDLRGFTHSVFFRFKRGTTRAQKSETRTKFLALKNQCRGMSIAETGDQDSKETVHQQYEQGYWTVFNSQANLNFYLDDCPAHQVFKKFVGPLLAEDDGNRKLGVVDVDGSNYHPGVFVFDFTSGRR